MKPWFAVLATAGLLTGAGVVASIIPAPVMAQVPTVEEGDQRLPAVELKPDERVRLQALSRGNAELTDADLPLLDKAAKWYVYRVTWEQYQNRKPPENRSVYEMLANEFYPLLIVPSKQPNFKPKESQLKFQQAFTKKLIDPIRRVLQNPKEIARINAGLILDRLSETGSDELAVPLVEILEDPKQIDAVKLYALRGLKNIFKGDPFLENATAFVNHQLEIRCIKAMENFLQRKPQFGKGRPDPLQIDAFRYLRREAIRAMGQTRYPAVAERRVIEARPAYDLLQIVHAKTASNAAWFGGGFGRGGGGRFGPPREGMPGGFGPPDGMGGGFGGDDIDSSKIIFPPPTLHEQVEAAAGVCQLHYRYYSDYRLDYAIYHLGQFFVSFGDRYEDDRTKNKGQSEEWKYLSYRLDQALAAMETDTKGLANAMDFVQRSRGMFKSIVSGGQAVGLRELRQWLDAHHPAEGVVYRGDLTSSLD